MLNPGCFGSSRQGDGSVLAPRPQGGDPVKRVMCMHCHQWDYMYASDRSNGRPFDHALNCPVLHNKATPHVGGVEYLLTQLMADRKKEVL